MFKSFATWALLAAVLASAAPTVDQSFDMELEAREFDLEQHHAEARAFFDIDLEGRDLESRDGLEDRDLEARTIKVSKGLADFEKVDTKLLGLNQIGQYGGIYYQGISAVAAVTSKILGIKPVSGNNIALYGTLTGLANSKPIITSQYSKSKVTSFTLDSLYFGCLGTAVLASKCTFALAGYDSNSKLIAYQSFLYQPGAVSTSANMQLAKLNSQFQGKLNYVRVATTYAGVNLLGSTAIDNINYTITQNL